MFNKLTVEDLSLACILLPSPGVKQGRAFVNPASHRTAPKHNSLCRSRIVRRLDRLGRTVHAFRGRLFHGATMNSVNQRRDERALRNLRARWPDNEPFPEDPRIQRAFARAYDCPLPLFCFHQESDSGVISIGYRRLGVRFAKRGYAKWPGIGVLFDHARGGFDHGQRLTEAINAAITDGRHSRRHHGCASSFVVPDVRIWNFGATDLIGKLRVEIIHLPGAGLLIIGLFHKTGEEPLR